MKTLVKLKKDLTRAMAHCSLFSFFVESDVHMDLEKKIAELLGSEAAILYSFAFSTISSAIPAFAKKGDLLVW